MSFAGIDIGGRKKGFHAAVVEDKNVIAGPQQLNAVDAVVSWLVPHEPSVVALDSPRTCAPAGEKSREGERALMNEVCGIRFTPEEAKLTGDGRVRRDPRSAAQTVIAFRRIKLNSGCAAVDWDEGVLPHGGHRGRRVGTDSHAG
jgi:hypothetical protein